MGVYCRKFNLSYFIVSGNKATGMFHFLDVPWGDHTSLEETTRHTCTSLRCCSYPQPSTGWRKPQNPQHQYWFMRLRFYERLVFFWKLVSVWIPIGDQTEFWLRIWIVIQQSRKVSTSWWFFGYKPEHEWILWNSAMTKEGVLVSNFTVEYYLFFSGGEIIKVAKQRCSNHRFECKRGHSYTLLGRRGSDQRKCGLKKKKEDPPPRKQGISSPKTRGPSAASSHPAEQSRKGFRAL